MGRVNEDVVRYPDAEDVSAKTPRAVFVIGVNSAAVDTHSEGAQFLKGTPAGGAHVSLRDESGAPYGAAEKLWSQKSAWACSPKWPKGVFK